MKFILTIFLCVQAQIVNAETSTIFKQPDAPLEITSYNNRYKASDRYGDGSIVHRVMVKNQSTQKIDAYGLGFYAFDSFKRDMGRPFVGYAMNELVIDASDNPSWEQKPSGAYLFKKHGQGLVYVAIVRFTDGTIWKADKNDISHQLQDFELELDESSERD